MNNLNIALYRAEKIESDKYVEGFLIKKNYDNQKVRYFILEDKNTEVAMTYEIDPTTLAINFNDMLDSQGNKIFASLSEDGKGGDITELQASSGTCLSCGDKLPKTLAVAIYEEMEFREIELNPHKCFRKREHNYVLIGNLEYKKVIGIQK